MCICADNVLFTKTPPKKKLRVTKLLKIASNYFEEVQYDCHELINAKFILCACK